MKTFILSTCLMVITIQSIAQVYRVHVDTIVYFKHPATITTHQAMLKDLVVYDGYGVDPFDLKIDCRTLQFSFSASNNDPTTYKITEVMDTTSVLQFETIIDNNYLARIIVADAKDVNDGKVIYVRWNELIDGKPVTSGWSSSNVILTRIDED